MVDAIVNEISHLGTDVDLIKKTRSCCGFGGLAALVGTSRQKRVVLGLEDEKHGII